MLELAIANNLAWYSSIFRAHDLAFQIEDHYWSTDAEPPPYYSCLVTRTSGAAAKAAQLERLAQLAARLSTRSWGFKDSFDQLPSQVLENLGLIRLRSFATARGMRGVSTPVAPSLAMAVRARFVTCRRSGSRRSARSPCGSREPGPNLRIDKIVHERHICCMCSCEGRRLEVHR
jgi:hypothetical protein